MNQNVIVCVMQMLLFLMTEDPVLSPVSAREGGSTDSIKCSLPKLGCTMENHIVFRLLKMFWHRKVLSFQPCCNSCITGIL